MKPGKTKSWRSQEDVPTAEPTLAVPTAEPTSILQPVVPTVTEVLYPTYPPNSCNCYRFGGVDSLKQLTETESPKCPFQGQSKNAMRAYAINYKWWYGNFTHAWTKMTNYPYTTEELNRF
jgi:hypothetical protein